MDFTRVTDEADLLTWQELWRVTHAFDFEALPADPIEDLRPVLIGPVGGEDSQLWLLHAASEAVAAVQLRMPLHDNLDLASLAPVVHPDHRRRGHGRAAVAAGLDVIRDLGRSRVLCEVPSRTRHENPAAAIELARSLGAKPLQVETRRVLDLKALEASTLDALDGESAELAAGYSTVGWWDHTPPEYVEDMAALMALMSTDPPQGELTLEPEVWDAARYLEHEASIIARRREHVTTAVRDDRTGQLVGFSDLGVPTGGVEVGYQWATVVRSDHRGHRLGMLAKVANLRRLIATMPEVRYLNTWNADVNRHMVSVNEKLGFKPVEQWSEWGLDL